MNPQVKNDPEILGHVRTSDGKTLLAWIDDTPLTEAARERGRKILEELKSGKIPVSGIENDK